MSIKQPFLLLALALTAAAGRVSAEGDRPEALREAAQRQARELARAVEQLQEAIIDELGGREERDLYRKADALLAVIDEFRGTLEEAADRDRLATRFATMDEQTHELLEAIEALGDGGRGLRREAARVRRADEELHFTLAAKDATPERAGLVLKRQSRQLTSATRELERTVQYALLKRPGQVAPTDFRRLVEAANRLARSAEAGARPEQLRKEFDALNTAWEGAVQTLRLIKPQENFYLIRHASRVDRLHERLHQLLGVKAERARLTIST